MASHKLERIESDIIKYLNNIIQNKAKDELLKTITLTDISLAKDMSVAKVYFTSISDLTHEEITKKVNEASSFLRGKLAENLEARNIPELRFIYDETIEYANRLEKIISSIHEND